MRFVQFPAVSLATAALAATLCAAPSAFASSTLGVSCTASATSSGGNVFMYTVQTLATGTHGSWVLAAMAPPSVSVSAMSPSGTRKTFLSNASSIETGYNIAEFIFSVPAARLGLNVLIAKEIDQDIMVPMVIFHNLSPSETLRAEGICYLTELG